MTKIKYVPGNLFDLMPQDVEAVIPHLCNCQKVWAAGFVIPLQAAYPKAAKVYKGADKLMLGTTQVVKATKLVTVCNMIAQDGFEGRAVRYNHLLKCLEKVGVLAEGKQIITIPFGTGIAGGDWTVINGLVEDCWLRRDIPVTVYYPPEKFTPPA